jgi:MATE family multidrug resistance protein
MDSLPHPLAGLRAELRSTTRLALPIVTVQLGMMLMGTIDTMMLGHLSPLGLAAGSLGNAASMTMLWFGLGLVSALEPLIAQAWGARDERALADHLERGLVLAAVVSVPLVLFLANIHPLFLALGQSPEVAREAAAYCRGIVWGILPILLFAALRQTLQAMSLIRPALWAIVLGNVANAAGNVVLIFGHLGVPALGVRGSAYSTSIARWSMFLFLFFAARRPLARFWRGFTRAAIERRGYLLMLRIGLLIGLHGALELLIFTTVAVLMGTMGVTALAGHQVTLSYAALSFMVPLGISGAASTRVGNAIGRSDMSGARRAAAAALLLGAGVMLVFALVLAAVPGPLAHLFTPDAGVVAVAVTLLPIAAVFQVFDGIQVVATGVLRGAADTAFPAAMALVGYWCLGLPIGWALAYRAGLGAKGLWWGLAVGLAAVALLLLGRIVARFRGEILRAGEARAEIPV